MDTRSIGLLSAGVGIGVATGYLLWGSGLMERRLGFRRSRGTGRSADAVASAAVEVASAAPPDATKMNPPEGIPILPSLLHRLLYLPDDAAISHPRWGDCRPTHRCAGGFTAVVALEFDALSLHRAHPCRSHQLLRLLLFVLLVAMQLKRC